MNVKFLGMIGLACRAGRLSVGEEGCRRAAREGRARLVLIAGDAAGNTKKTIINTCEYYNVRYEIAATKEQLGRFTGCAERAAVSVNDDNFAKAILDRLDHSDN